MAGNQRYDEKVQLTYGPPAMTQTLTPPAEDEIVYPGEDGEPLAESYNHLYAILVTLEVLRPYLTGQPATVLADPFLYYSPGLARLRIAPDVMVIFDVAQGAGTVTNAGRKARCQALFLRSSPPALVPRIQS